MLSDKDKSVVDAYARTGMSLDTLIISFPKFDAADIEAVYLDVKNKVVDEEDVGVLNSDNITFIIDETIQMDLPEDEVKNLKDYCMVLKSINSYLEVSK